MLPMGAIFEPSMSVGPEEDNVTSLNLAVAVSKLVSLSDSSSVNTCWEFPPAEPSAHSHKTENLTLG